jgi:hypothetical protein
MGCAPDASAGVRAWPCAPKRQTAEERRCWRQRREGEREQVTAEERAEQLRPWTTPSPLLLPSQSARVPARHAAPADSGQVKRERKQRVLTQRRWRQEAEAEPVKRPDAAARSMHVQTTEERAAAPKTPTKSIASSKRHAEISRQTNEAAQSRSAQTLGAAGGVMRRNARRKACNTSNPL